MKRAAEGRGAAAVVAAALALAHALAPASASARDEPIVHEPIPPDPEDDLVLRVSLDGDLPAAIHTPAGIIGAPDPLRPPAPSEAAYGPSDAHSSFAPDTDTRRPEINQYDDPFTPSTAPFKRLEAFDAVRSDYRVEVRDQHLVPLAAIHAGAPPGAEEDAFYADLVVDVPPEGSVRIPSVGPGARILRARLGAGSTEMPFRVVRDGADNWFLQPTGRAGGVIAGPVRARLVMELAMPRAAFGGALADVGWSELPFVAPLPENVARDAATVRAAIGVSRAVRPRQAIAKLVEYFRGFADSDEPPPSRGSVYLDLALSKRGVCRHRSYAFLVTAQSLGIPTRLVENEEHAWVEVHDGLLWRRIDLGGAGVLSPEASETLAKRTAYTPAADAFPWPHGSERGDDAVPRPRTEATGANGARGGTAAGGSNGGTAAGSSPGNLSPGSATPGKPATAAPPKADRPPADPDDHRPPAAVTLVVSDPVVHRGVPLHVRGDVRAGGDPCGHVSVELSLAIAATGKRVALGTLATRDDGTFDGTVVPTGVPLGDYEVLAETPGDTRCGRGRN